MLSLSSPKPFHIENVSVGDAAAYKASTEQKPDSETFWVRLSTDPVAFFTMILAVATIGLWIFTAKLWRATTIAISDARTERTESNVHTMKALKHAKRSADASTKSVKANKKLLYTANEMLTQSRQMSELDMRPWVQVDAQSAKVAFGGNTIKVHFRVLLTNTGKTSARDASITMSHLIGAPSWEEVMTEFQEMRHKDRQQSPIWTISPGAKVYQNYIAYPPLDTIPWHDEGGDLTATCVMLVQVRYSTHPGDQCWTEQTFTVAHEAEAGFFKDYYLIFRLLSLASSKIIVLPHFSRHIT